MLVGLIVKPTQSSVKATKRQRIQEFSLQEAHHHCSLRDRLLVRCTHIKGLKVNRCGDLGR